MRICISVLVFLLHLTVLEVARADTNTLEMSRTCDGSRLGEAKRYPITEWNGRNIQKFSQTIYDFRIDCGSSYRHLIDVYLASTDDQRYEKRGSSLYKHTGEQSKQMPIPESERDCRMDKESDWVSRTPDELFKICRGNGNCEIEHSAYKVAKMVKSCRRPRTEYRNVPLWEAFPTGYAPLPGGARIVKIAKTRPVAPVSSVSNNVPTNTKLRSTGNGSGVGMFILILIVGGAVVFLWKPVARFYYTGFVPHPAKKYLDMSIANDNALDTQSFERAMAQATQGPFPDIMAAKGAKLRYAMDEHAAMMRSVEERERARTRARAASGFARDFEDKI